jgi:hypothetical protein
MTTKVETITPEIATEILEKRNPRNRTISEGTVSAYATDMRNKRWTLTHQGLAFDENGDLIDGQHRLWACFQSGCSFESNVTRGIPVKQQKGGIEINSMDNIDNGRLRSNGSQMTLSHGIKNGHTISGACRQIAAIITEPSAITRGRFSIGSAMFVHAQYGADIDAVFNALDPQHRRAYILAPLAMYHHGEGDKALEFCRQVATLEQMAAPVRVVIKYLEAKHTAANPAGTVRMIAKRIHAFNDGVEKCERFVDDNMGLKYLLALYPSLNKRIADNIKPALAAKVPRKHKRQ